MHRTKKAFVQQIIRQVTKCSSHSSDGFEEMVKDHRRGPAVRHDLKEMIVMAICAVLCGCDGWVDVANWCEEEEGWLRSFLELAKGTPSHDTFGEVFRVLDAKVFESCFRQWICATTKLTLIAVCAVAVSSPIAARTTALNSSDSSCGNELRLRL